jgi:hypothetical protein
MLDALRFVAASVAKKDYVQDLTHFRIVDGRVTGFNGVIALSSDIDVDLNVFPHAARMLAAIKACTETISLNVTPAGKLAIKSGKFKSFVDCLPFDNVANTPAPDGDSVELGPSFLPGIRALAPIMGIDASRPWSMGIRLQSQTMLATNNVMLGEYWHGVNTPLDVVIPDVCIRELLRIDEDPTRVQMTDHSISFWFGENRWLRSSLIEGSMWPMAKMDEILSGSTGEQTELDPAFFEAVDTLKVFLEDSGTLYLSADRIGTSKNDGEGTSIECPCTGQVDLQAYHHRQLALLGEVATTIDWTAYPRPCMFRGERLRGALVGQRV